MKKFMLIIVSALFLLYQNNANAQCDLPFNEKGEYEVQEVVKLDSTINESDIYGAAILAFAEVFKDARDVIEVENEKLGFLAGNFVIHSEPFSMGMWRSYFTFSFRIDIKDNKYRVTIKYLTHTALSTKGECSCPNRFKDEKCGSGCLTKKWWKDQKCAAHTEVLEFVTKLNTLIENSLTVDDNW